MAKSTVAVRFTGDVSQLKRAVGEADGKLKGLGGRIGGFAKTAALGLTGLGVAGGALAKGFIDAATESAQVTKQTEAVLKSMGTQAGHSAKSIADLSEELSKKSGLDDEMIQSGQNVLLTFGKVRNEVGKGNDIFDRAAASALDMSVALGTDLQSSTVMLGKALNDPIKGITAMSRAGVSFTDQQKEQIKTMVEAGDTLGAQKIIMAEMEKQFGGSAEAQATAAGKLKVAWGNIQEELGAKLLPLFETAATWLADRLPMAMERVQTFIDQSLVPAFNRVGEFVRQVAAVVQEHWPQIQAVITTAVEHVRTVIEGFVTVATTLWNNFGNNILEFVQRVWPAVQQVIEGVLATIRGIIQTVTSLIRGDWAGVWEGIKGVVSGVWNAIQGIVRTALETMRLAIGAALEVIGSAFKSAWNGILDFFRGVPGRISRIASGMFDGIKNAFRSALNWIIRGWNSLEFKIPGFDPPGPGPSFGGFTLGVPNIDTLHTGGVYHAPRPGGEGLALLKDGERVLSPGESRRSGGAPVVININGGTFLGTNHTQLKRELVGLLNQAARQGTR